MEIARVTDRAADDGALAIERVIEETEWHARSAPHQHSHGGACADVDRNAPRAGRVRSQISRRSIANRVKDLRAIKRVSVRVGTNKVESAWIDFARFAERGVPV